MHKAKITLLLASACMPAWPASRTAPDPDKLLACAEMQDSSARLACFDREVAPLVKSRQEQTPVVRAPEVKTRPEPATQPEATTEFGAEQLDAKQRTPASAEAQTLHAHIAELKTAASGRFLVVLDNGQVWRHEDAYMGNYLKQGEAITISKAAMGSYRLTRDAGQAKNWIRVTRVQ
jgi:hypothetical protein